VQQDLIYRGLLQRFRNRSTLLIAVLVGSMFCLIRVFMPIPRPFLGELVFPFVFIAGHLYLSPIPWQWTGDERTEATAFRGFAQALIFNSLWVAAALGLMSLLGPPFPQGSSAHPFPSARGAGESIRPPDPRLEWTGRPPPVGFDPRLGLGFLNVALAIVFGWLLAQKEATEAKQRKTEDLLRQSRAQALQNQLQPHVLYNALNSLAELVREDPIAAEEVVAQLADLYRLLTVHGKSELVSLGEERRLVEAYLTMEQMRLGERLTVEWEWPNWADEQRVPPLLLQPLVENAIKHGISPEDKGGILSIRCARSEEILSLRVENTGSPLPPHPVRGVGLENLEARLELWTRKPGGFTLAQEGAWTIADLRWKERRNE
jgi:two-component sensor histidine kinase